MKWQSVVVTMFETVGLSIVATADKIATTDQEYRLFGQRMFMDTQHAKALKIALDALHEPLEAIAFDPELHGRFEELQSLRALLQGPMLGGASFAVTMRQIRDSSLK